MSKLLSVDEAICSAVANCVGAIGPLCKQAEGPTHPVYVVPEFATITHFEYVGPDDESVISSAPPSDDGN